MKNKLVLAIMLSSTILILTACGNQESSSLKNQEMYVADVAVEQIDEVKEDEANKAMEVEKAEVLEEIKDEDVATVDSTQEISFNNLDGKVSKEDFRLIINGVEVLLGTDINDLLPKLGEPDDYTSARSCMDDGEEKTFVYGGYTVITYPDKEKDMIYLVELGDGAVTDANIGLGSKREDVEEAYGTTYETMGDNYIYEISVEQAITVQYENDIVTWIDMYYR